MRKRLVWYAVLLIMLQMFRIVFYGQEDKTGPLTGKFSNEDKQETVEEYRKTNILYESENDFSDSIWEKYGLLVRKGTGQGDRIEFRDPYEPNSEKISDDNPLNGKERKYLGTTIDGYLVENPDYPADAYRGKPFSRFNWLENKNRETSLWFKIGGLAKEDQDHWYNYYLELIKTSFEEEYTYDPKTDKGFDWHNFTPEIEEAMMKSAILVYPMAEGKRTLVSKTTKERISQSL